MEPAVLDSGSMYLKAGFASPDQDPSIVRICIPCRGIGLFVDVLLLRLNLL